MTVGEFLNKYRNPYKTVLISEESTIQEVLEVMIAQGEERTVYVVDAEETLRGVITTGKLAEHFFHEEIAPQSGFSPSSNIIHYLTAEHAKDIMDRDIIFCTREETLESAIAKMFGKRVKKTIPVVDDSMHVIDTLNIISIMEARLAEAD